MWVLVWGVGLSGELEYCINLMEEITRCLYASLLIQVSFRTLQFLRYFQSIGVLIIVLAEMMNDVGTPHAPFRSR